jgi:transposase InsO family protein
MSFWTKRAT